jgi:hypothetical protein
MKRRKSQTEEQLQNHATATAKVRMWGNRADQARQAGRKADAERCHDKMRDWASKARQIEQSQKAGT